MESRSSAFDRHDDVESAPRSTVRPVAQRAVVTPTTEEVKAHMHLVHRVVAGVQRKLPSNVMRDDLVAAGTMGLLDAMRKNYAELGSPGFESYARIRIRGAIMDNLRQLDWSPRRRKPAGANAASPASAASPNTPAPEPRPFRVVPLDDLGSIPARALVTESPGELTEKLELHRQVGEAVAQLPEKERRIVELRYVHGVPSKMIAALLGVSEARVSQLQARAVATLRAILCDGDVQRAA